jgi:hypothetical protein
MKVGELNYLIVETSCSYAARFEVISRAGLSCSQALLQTDRAILRLALG